MVLTLPFLSPTVRGPKSAVVFYSDGLLYSESLHESIKTEAERVDFHVDIV